jgi:hypothetical protein
MDHLLDFCLSEQQRKIVELSIRGITKRDIAARLGITERNVFKRLQLVKARAAMAGIAPDADLDYQVPVGFNVKGTSTLVDKTTGESKLQWIKTDVNKEVQHEAMLAAIEALKEDLPKYAPVAFNATTSADLATVYTITDAHVGMKAWGKETGADWDLEIAEQTITSAIIELVNAAPCSQTAVVAQLGDFLHADSITPMTPTSGHLLDADDRFSKVVQVAIRILRRVIAYCLTKHERIVFINAEGNHDLSSSIWLRELFKAVYENEPRIDVVDTPLPYYVYHHGDTMLAWHHGHLKKNDALPLMFASQFHDIWGKTKKRYCHTGHRHHYDEKEHSGMYVVQHSTIAARDAYAARGGWMSERTMKAITYHKKFGEVGRITVTPEMFA